MNGRGTVEFCFDGSGWKEEKCEIAVGDSTVTWVLPNGETKTAALSNCLVTWTWLCPKRQDPDAVQT